VKNTVLAAIFLNLFSATARYPQSSCVTSVDVSRLRKSITGLSDSYGDVRRRINCSKPAGNQILICRSNVLILMERLDQMAMVYAIENATKSELDHREPSGANWLNQVLKTCHSDNCICLEYKKHADVSLGGLSPYTAPPPS
jgi:hypothetical protein